MKTVAGLFPPADRTNKSGITFTPRSSVRRFRPVGSALVLLGLIASNTQGCAATLTNLSFISNSGGFINDTIVDGTTSPIGFTAVGLSQPFLNNANSTVSLPFGAYYAYSFIGIGQHIGAGTISGSFDGTPFSQAATFPSDLVTVANFFTFTFPSGDTLKIGTTGLSADRIRIIADGPGLASNGDTDSIYSFNFTAVPEPTSTTLLGIGLMGALARRSRRISA